MKKTYIVIAIILFSFSSVSHVSAMPPPCSDNELLSSSAWAVEGWVTDIQCGETYDSGECEPAEWGYEPRLLQDCIATIKVTRVLKGNYNVGDEIKIPYHKQIQHGDGECIIPGVICHVVELHSVIRYYAGTPCWNNLEEIREPGSEPEPSPPIGLPEEMRITYAPLIILISFIIIISVYLLWRKTKKVS